MKTSNYVYFLIIICLTLISHQSTAQHDRCGCTGEYNTDGLLTKIEAINPFTNKKEILTVVERDGYYIWQGDIIVGKIEEENGRNVFLNSGFWPNNTIPYVLDAAFPQAMVARIDSAAVTITSETNLSVIPRTTETIYVEVIRKPGVCNAFVGMPTSGLGLINLGTTCSYGNVMHEFLHAAGMHHEHTRENRDTFVTIDFDNIRTIYQHNFIQNINGWSDHGSYDYESIMHYGAYAFAINQNKKTIITAGGQPIGQRVALSASDIQSVNRMYPSCTSSTLTYNGIIEPGRYKTSGDLNVEGDILTNTFVIMSAGTALKFKAGSSIKSGTDAIVKLLSSGCNID